MKRLTLHIKSSNSADAFQVIDTEDDRWTDQIRGESAAKFFTTRVVGGHTRFDQLFLQGAVVTDGDDAKPQRVDIPGIVIDELYSPAPVAATLRKLVINGDAFTGEALSSLFRAVMVNRAIRLEQFHLLDRFWEHRSLFPRADLLEMVKAKRETLRVLWLDNAEGFGVRDVALFRNLQMLGLGFRSYSGLTPLIALVSQMSNATVPKLESFRVFVDDIGAGGYTFLSRFYTAVEKHLVLGRDKPRKLVGLTVEFGTRYKQHLEALFANKLRRAVDRAVCATSPLNMHDIVLVRFNGRFITDYQALSTFVINGSHDQLFWWRMNMGHLYKVRRLVIQGNSIPDEARARFQQCRATGVRVFQHLEEIDVSEDANPADVQLIRDISNIPFRLSAPPSGAEEEVMTAEVEFRTGDVDSMIEMKFGEFDEIIGHDPEDFDLLRLLALEEDAAVLKEEQQIPIFMPMNVGSRVEADASLFPREHAIAKGEPVDRIPAPALKNTETVNMLGADSLFATWLGELHHDHGPARDITNTLTYDELMVLIHREGMQLVISGRFDSEEALEAKKTELRDKARAPPTYAAFAASATEAEKQRLEQWLKLKTCFTHYVYTKEEAYLSISIAQRMSLSDARRLSS